MPNPWFRDGNAIAPADFLGTTNNMPLKFRTNDTERMRIGANGNVGIGTTSPALPLHVQGSRIQLESGSPGSRRLFLRSDGTEVDVQSDTNNLYIHSSGPAGKNGVFLNPFPGQGNVGVGTNGPVTKLHVVGDRVQLESGGRRLFLRSDGADVDVQSDTNNLYIHSSGPAGRNGVFINPFPGQGNVGVGTNGPVTKLHVVGDRVLLDSGVGGARPGTPDAAGRRLFLRSDGADVDVQSDTSNIFIHSSGPRGRNNVVINPFGGEGNVGIGTGNPGTKLEVAGDIRANDVFLTSDATLKCDIAPVVGALGKLQRIRGVSFVRVSPGDFVQAEAPRRLGVIAQEVEPVLPELVDERGGEGSKAVDYAGLTAFLIEALKELADENAVLRRRVDGLERVMESAANG